MADRSDFVEVARGRTAAWVRIAYLMCGDWAHAEDLVQTALLRLYLKWPRINLDGVDAYARRTILRLVIDESRRPHRRREIPGDLPEFAAATGDPDTGMDVRAALLLVPTRQRAVLILRYFNQLSVAETAEVMRVTQGTVKSQTSRGLQTMRHILGGPQNGPETASTTWVLEIGT